MKLLKQLIKSTAGIILAFILLIPSVVHAQKEASIWYFGDHAGLDFNQSPLQPLANNAIIMPEGCASIANKYGNLLFYTDGVDVYDKTHTKMPNGSGLTGHMSSTQSAIIIQNPDSANIFYIFTTDGFFGDAAYSVVDTSLMSGLGDIRTKNVLLNNNGSEKLSAVKHRNGKDVWVVTHHGNNNKFLAYLVTANGVNTTAVVSSIGQSNSSVASGQLKISPDGTKIALADYDSKIVELYDFNTSNGAVSNVVTLASGDGYYGLEFSPSGRYLYMISSKSGTSGLWQFETRAGSASAVLSSKTVIYSTSQYVPLGMQLAPDGKIYIAINNQQFLGCINKPDRKGASSNFVLQAQTLGLKKSTAGLPTFNQSYFYKPAVEMLLDTVLCGNLTITAKNTGDTDLVISSHWDFGDSTSDTGKQVTKAYTAHGTYTLKNIIQFPGKTDTFTQVIITRPFPVAKIEKIETSKCLRNNRFVFADSSKHFTGNTNKLNRWLYSDTSTTQVNSGFVIHKYTKAGTFIVTLISTSTNNCTDTATETVTLLPSAKTSFASKGERCLTANTLMPMPQATVDTPGAITGYLWDFGDGTTSTQPSPQKTYPDTGNYNITLIAFEKNGCNDTATGSFTVLPSPKAEFTSGDVCFKDSSLFKNTSFITKGNLNYLWNYGDGSIASDFEKNYLYSDTGKYSVKLIAISDSLCTDTFEKEIYVKPKPVADFSANGSCTQNSVEFKDKSIRYTIPVKNNNWVFGDGNTGNSSGDIKHIYTTQNQYLVKLVTEAGNGCKDSIVKSLFINTKPDISLTITDDEQCLKGNRFEFKTTFNLFGYSSKSFLWYFDNAPGVFTLPTLWASFSQTGLHTLKIVIENDSGCRDSVIKDFVVHPQVKTDITLNDTAQCEKGNIFTITNNSVVNGTGNIVNYNWLFSDNTTSKNPSPLPKTFGTEGLHWVQCVMETDKGCLDTLKQNLEVYFNPAINFNAQNVCLGVEVIFDNITPDPNNKIIKWQWDFGDGSKSALKNPGRKYSAAGNYLVNLIATTADGCADTMEKFFPNLVSLRPTAYFEDSVLGSSGIKTMYRFTNGSTNATQYLWDFGDGTISNDENPEKTFEDVGHFLVNLTAENQYGCKDQYNKKLFVVPDMEVVIPNAFTPNNRDDLNPVFKVEGLYLTKEFSMDIFNRWGERVFATDKVTTGWDGTYAGQASPPGMYMYVIRVMDLKNKVNVYYGSFALIR